MKTIKVFISYARSEYSIRDRFLKQCKKRIEFKKETYQIEYWYDETGIVPGDNWDLEIRNRINTSDLIVLLISDKFLSSDYITNTELPLIIGSCKDHGVGRVGIVIRNCAYSSHPFLSKIQLVPSQQARLRPVEEWENSRSAWSAVMKGFNAALKQRILHFHATTERTKWTRKKRSYKRKSRRRNTWVLPFPVETFIRVLAILFFLLLVIKLIQFHSV